MLKIMKSKKFFGRPIFSNYC